MPSRFLKIALSILCCTVAFPAGAQSTVLFTGDILLDRGVRRVIEQKGADALFTRGIDSVFARADAVVGNLECPATKIHAPTYKRFIFRAEPEWLETLRAHGITHLNLANNHSVDQGRRGLSDTQLNIRQHGMVAVGAGATMDAASVPVVLCREPRPVYLLATLRLPLENMAYLPHLPSVSQESEDSLLMRVRRLRQADSSCVIVVSPHWGWEHKTVPVPSQRQLARRIIDAGADLIVGHHTHTLQTVEEYRGRRIYYSVGNFIFDQQKPLNSRACMVGLTVHADSIAVSTIPIRIRQCVPHVRERKDQTIRNYDISFRL